jgi:hypothetical protein
LIVYEDFVVTVVLDVVVIVFVVAPAFCVLVFFIKLTPANRLVFTDACVRSLRAAA